MSTTPNGNDTPRPELERLQLATHKEVAGLLRVHPKSVHRMVAYGQIPAPIRIGGVNRWRLTDLEKFLSGAAGAAHSSMAGLLPTTEARPSAKGRTHVTDP